MKISIDLDGVWLYEIEDWLASWAVVFCFVVPIYNWWRMRVVADHYRYKHCEHRHGYKHIPDFTFYVAGPTSWYDRYMERK